MPVNDRVQSNANIVCMISVFVKMSDITRLFLQDEGWVN